MISKIEIKGYKSIKELSMELKPINILIGSNGVGKTNFISFFKFLNTIYEQRLETYSLKNGADNILHFGRKETSKTELYIEFDKINAYTCDLAYTNNNTLFVDAEYTHFYKGIFGSNNWKSELIGRANKESQLTGIKTAISKYVREYFQSFRVYHFHDTSENAPLRTDADINDNLSLKENGSNLSAFLYYLQQKHPQNFRRIERSIQSIAPFFERFRLQPFRLNEQRIQLEWVERNHPDRYFNASHLSDGTIRFIALATLLLQPEPPEVIIIDEPELGLHPVAINKLAGMLRSASEKQCQIIISTQSVGLVNNFHAEEIVTVDRIGDETVFARLEESSLKQWMDDYSIGDLWSKSIIKGQP
jgi:predicted ATPase